MTNPNLQLFVDILNLHFKPILCHLIEKAIQEVEDEGLDTVNTDKPERALDQISDYWLYCSYRSLQNQIEGYASVKLVTEILDGMQRVKWIETAPPDDQSKQGVWIKLNAEELKKQYRSIFDW